MSRPAVTPTAEDYLTLIWKSLEWPGSAPATMDLADQLGVTPSTVSANLKKLARDGLIEYEPYGPITLTPDGRAVAVSIVRRHRIIETYLVRRLGLTWDQVHREADLLEHAVSDLVLDRMDDELGHPRTDPHGDPIPQPDGTLARTDLPHLAEVGEGVTVTVERVSDRAPAVLRYLAAKGIAIGDTLRIETRSEAAGYLEISHHGQRAELTITSAHNIRVRPGTPP